MLEGLEDGDTDRQPQHEGIGCTVLVFRLTKGSKRLKVLYMELHPE